MTTGSIVPKLFTLTWPLVIGNLLQTVYNLADMFWVGRVSGAAVAAVSLMFPLSFMFISTAMGITAATIALVSQHIGAGNQSMADKVVAQTALLTTVVATVLGALGLLFRESILTTIGASGQVYIEALAYIEIIFLSLPFTFLFFAFRGSLQGAGDTKTAMWLMVLSAGINVVLDPVLILGWGPFPALGTQGAAIATFASRAFVAVAGLYLLLRGGYGVNLNPRELLPDWELQKQLVSIGYPATIDGWARSFAAVVMVGLVAQFSVAAIAAYGVGVRLMSVTWTISGGVGQATATGVGQNLGSNRPERAVEVTWKAMVATMALLFGIAGVVTTFPAAAIRLFIDDPAVITEGIVFLRIIAPFWAFFGGVMVIQGAFRGAGTTKAAMMLSLLSRWILRVPVALVLAFAWSFTIPGSTFTVTALDWGVEGLWWAYATGGFLSFLFAVWWFKLGTWRGGAITNTEYSAEPTD
ncbi:MATE family efflux transporter [Haloarcula marina]|uniref:MATE family efflux transporter n=1 Tax=Haloarcula marina TaxID=2961574 RepID=UPI0020B7177B|nr:MATE family efflux transporter [Halomicroarcula marina]